MTRFDTPLTLTITNNMQNPPQNVSERYVNNLLRNGKNNLFFLHYMQLENAEVDGHVIGQYIRVELCAHNKFTQPSPAWQGVGATPSQAVRRALEKFGVTFK